MKIKFKFTNAVCKFFGFIGVFGLGRACTFIGFNEPTASDEILEKYDV